MRIEQILTRLIGIAVKYSPDGGRLSAESGGKMQGPTLVLWLPGSPHTAPT